MQRLRASGIPVVSLLMLTIAAIVVSGLAQPDLEQRVAGLEGRVAVLEQEVARLQHGGDATPVPQTYTITGTLRLRQELDRPVEFQPDIGYCAGTRVFDDISTGTSLTVLDGSGTTLGTTQLRLAEGFAASDPASNVCEFAFSVEVSEATFYTVRIGRRTGPTYSLQEMRDSDWTIDLSIGA
jgi:hypothetical protein